MTGVLMKTFWHIMCSCCGWRASLSALQNRRISATAICCTHAPIFVTTLDSDIRHIKPGLQAGDINMLLERLLVFRFHAKLNNPDRSIPPCGRCFSDFILIGAKLDEPANNGKRASCSATGSTPEAKRHAIWRVDQVLEFLHEIELGHLWCGRALEVDLLNELGMTKLQARKQKSRLP